jgi:ribosome maturation factor RimP
LDDEVCSSIHSLAAPICEELAFELVDVEWTRGEMGQILRLTLDKPGGISVSECRLVSLHVSDAIEREDLIPGFFNLEVTSPGLTRPLKKLDDYKKFSGRMAKITLKEKSAEFENRSNFSGHIIGVNENLVEFEDMTGQKFDFPFEMIAKARLDFEWKKTE